MKSKLVSLYDYKQISMEVEPVIVTTEDLDGEAANDMETLRRRHTCMADAEIVAKGDICTLALESTNPRYCKPSLPLNVGLGLFAPQLEEALIGQKMGASLEVEVGGDVVKATILSCKRNTVPEKVTDEMVTSLQLEGVSTVEEYRQYLHRWYLDFYHREYTTYYAYELLSEVCKESVWEMDEGEVEQCYQDWRKAEEEEQEFHQVKYLENYPGELEETRREGSLLYLQMALIDCQMRGMDASGVLPDARDRQAQDEMRQRVCQPLEKYLFDKVTIVYKED